MCAVTLELKLIYLTSYKQINLSTLEQIMSKNPLLKNKLQK